MEELQHKMKKYSYKLKNAKNSKEAEIYKNKLRFYKTFQAGGALEDREAVEALINAGDLEGAKAKIAELGEALSKGDVFELNELINKASASVPTVATEPEAPVVEAEAPAPEAPVVEAVAEAEASQAEAPVAVEQPVQDEIDNKIRDIIDQLTNLKNLAENIKASIASLPKSQTEQIDINIREAARSVHSAISAKINELKQVIEQKKADAKERTFPNLDNALSDAANSVKGIGESVTVKIDVQTPEEVEAFLTESETFLGNLNNKFNLSEQSQAGGRRHRRR